MQSARAGAPCPLYHDAVETPAYKRRWREAYRLVNARFAEAAAEVAADGATVWVTTTAFDQKLPGGSG